MLQAELASGADTYLKCKVVGVAVVNGLVNGLDTNDRDDWAKGLLPCNAHVLHTDYNRRMARGNGLDWEVC